MNEGTASANHGTAARYIASQRHPLSSRVETVKWIATIPWRSYRGGKALFHLPQQPLPPEWAKEVGGRRVLIVGSGPSLDRVDDSFFAGFDTIIYINFALTRANGTRPEYFFSTDLSPIETFLNARGDDAFLRLGKARCIYNPLFLDQMLLLKPAAYDLLTVIPCDGADWSGAPQSAGGGRLPIIWRYRPRQPLWDTFELPAAGRPVPAIIHTSALSAILFAGIQGAREIGMIGCDFSDGRAASANDAQNAPNAGQFNGAVCPAPLRRPP